MTMFITAVTVKRVVQVSDRRISIIERGILRPRDDNTNKAIVYDGRLGVFSVAYYGLAEMDGEPMDHVLESVIAECRTRSNTLKAVFDNLTSLLSDRFSRIKHQIPSTGLSCAGYSSTGQPFRVLIANEWSQDGREVAPGKEFACRVSALPENAAKLRRSRRDSSFDIGGICVPDEMWNKWGCLRRQGFFHRVSDEYLKKTLVREIQKFAQSPESKGLVGTNCISTIIEGPPSRVRSCQYHTLGRAGEGYMPNFVFDDQRIKDMKMYMGREPPPWCLPMEE